MSGLRQSVATFSHGTEAKIGFIALMYIDLVLTLFALQHGFSELNPFMATLLSKPAELLLAKVVAPLFVAWLVPHKLLLPSIGLMLAVTGWNLVQLLTFL